MYWLSVCMFSPYSLWELLLQPKIRLIRDSKLPVGVKVFVIISLTLFLCRVNPGQTSKMYPASHPVAPGIASSSPTTLN